MRMVYSHKVIVLFLHLEYRSIIMLLMVDGNRYYIVMIRPYLI